MTKEQKGMLIGMYFAKFENLALDSLGFANFIEAFNIISLIAQINPNSLRNYRDEFAPAFPTKRLGWHKREMHPSRKKILNLYYNLDLNDFTNLIKDIIYKNKEDRIIEELETEIENSTFAKRMLTGQAAENYFFENYKNIDLFKNGEILNTTKYGCGFDFKLNFENKYFAIEVKGLEKKEGSVALTNKEYKVAEKLKDNYFIFIVKNFIEKPEHIFFQNPIFSNQILFKKEEREVIQISYNFYV
jgi:hypothetical protein